MAGRGGAKSRLTVKYRAACKVWASDNDLYLGSKLVGVPVGYEERYVFATRNLSFRQVYNRLKKAGYYWSIKGQEWRKHSADSRYGYRGRAKVSSAASLFD